MISSAQHETITMENAIEEDRSRILEVLKTQWGTAESEVGIMFEGNSSEATQSHGRQRWATVAVCKKSLPGADDTNSIPGLVVGVALWQIEDHDLEERKAEFSKWITALEKLDPATALDEITRLWGCAYAYELNKAAKRSARLRYLVVDPRYRQRGLGRKLLLHGLQEIDKFEVPCYLSATNDGACLYAKHGFNFIPYSYNISGFPVVDGWACQGPMVRPALWKAETWEAMRNEFRKKLEAYLKPT